MWTTRLAASLLLVMGSQTVLASYNCTRLGVECFGTCDSASGACTMCNQGYEGYDCTLRTDTKNAGGCVSGNPCKNGGICYDTSVSGVFLTSCYCHYEYYGDTCHFPRASNECFNDRMIVNVNPGKNFAGIVGLQSMTGFCDISPVNNLLTGSTPFILAGGRNRWEGYAAELHFSMDPCGGSPTISRNATTTTYTYDVLVQYDVMATSPSLDELVSFSCTVSSSPASSSGRTAVLFSVTDEMGVPIDSPKLGSAITISFSVDPSSMFEDITVKSCKVYDSTKTNFRPVVVDSCAVPPFGQSLVKVGRGRNSLNILIHKFSSNPRLHFECQVKVCMPGDYTCVMPTLCDAMTGQMMGTSATGTASTGSLSGTSTGTGGMATDPLASLTGYDMSSLNSLTNLLLQPAGRRKRDTASMDKDDNIVFVRARLI